MDFESVKRRYAELIDILDLHHPLQWQVQSRPRIAALAAGDRFTVLTQGRVVDQFKRGERDRDQIMGLMAGGRRLAAAESGSFAHG